MSATPSSLVLSPEEIYEITHYRRSAEQLRELARMGIPATRRHDNTVCVLRMHLKPPAEGEVKERPKLKLT